MGTAPASDAVPWHTAAWFNTPAPLALEDLRGQVVLLHAFQMLCPACVSHGLPQAQRIHGMLGASGVAVVGLHSVFEHHAAMQPEALQAFIHEYRLTFPIAVDQPVAGQRLPATMRALQLQGTPSLLLLDRAGRVRMHRFGVVDDIALGCAIGRLLAEGAPDAAPSAAPGAAAASGAVCDAAGCAVPA